MYDCVGVCMCVCNDVEFVRKLSVAPVTWFAAWKERKNERKKMEAVFSREWGRGGEGGGGWSDLPLPGRTIECEGSESFTLCAVSLLRKRRKQSWKKTKTKPQR